MAVREGPNSWGITEAAGRASRQPGQAEAWQRRPERPSARAPPGGRAIDTRLLPLDQVDRTAVERLLDDAFGRDRRGRTAYRLREGTRPIGAMSAAAVAADGALAASIQCWPLALVEPTGARHRLVLVGPVAVDPDRQNRGLGGMLMRHMLDVAERTGEHALMLIGDPDYYSRLFGFTAAATAGWEPPGPVERHRLLARLAPGLTLPAVGRLAPAPDLLAAAS